MGLDDRFLLRDAVLCFCGKLISVDLNVCTGNYLILADQCMICEKLLLWPLL